MSDGPLLFRRGARLTIQSTTTPLYADAYDVKTQPYGVIIEKLHMTFDIEHNSTKHPNQCLIKVTNLPEELRVAFRRDNLKITLEAGYEGLLSTIFSGDVTYALSSLDNTDWVTTIQGGDGDRVLSHARVRKSYAPGVKLGDIVADVFRSAGQTVPDSVRQDDAFQTPVNSGLALDGTYKSVLTKILRPLGYSWSIQNGKPVVLREYDTAGELLEISEGNGMIASPEFSRPNRKGEVPDVTVKTLLFPGVRPGHPVRIKARDLTGTFKVKKVKHRGDNLSGDWVTEIVIRPVATAGKKTIKPQPKAKPKKK